MVPERIVDATAAGVRRIGMVLPSSNTVVEPTCIALGAMRGGISMHFARFRLTAVTVEDPAQAYYDSGLIREAALQLADARCDAICWNGSAGGVVGFDRDRELVAEVRRRCGIGATTSSLAILDRFRELGVLRFAMVTLNPPAMNDEIARNFAAEGYDCILATGRTDIADNFAMANVAPEAVAQSVLQCAGAQPDAIIVYGTNTRGALVADALTERLGIPVIDSVSAGMAGALQLLGFDDAWSPH